MLKPIKSISKHKYIILAVGYTLWLTTVSLTPLDGIDLPSFRFADKIVHYFLYFFLILVWLKALKPNPGKFFSFLLVVILWGVLIEFIQGNFISGRSGEVLDALANSLGAITGLFFYRRFL